MQNRRRVVITGIGCVTPLGINVERSWELLKQGVSGISSSKNSDYFSKTRSKVAGKVPIDTQALDGSTFNPNDFLTKDVRKIGLFAKFSVCAAQKAIEDSGILMYQNLNRKKVGVSIGSGIGGLYEIEDSAVSMDKTGRLSAFFVISALINLASSSVSVLHNFQGPLSAPTAACATGNYSIANAADLIRYNKADVVIAGSTENPICHLGVSGFDKMKALSSKFNDTPTKASRPWDKNRDGFVISDGSGVLVLEEYEHAKKRNAKIYAEILGYGYSSDANHLSAPHPDGHGASASMNAALDDAMMSCDEIDYINAHGTSTPLGDLAEVRAIKHTFGELAYKIPISSLKSAIGHSLGGAGSIEAVFSMLSIRDGVLLPTLNLEEPDTECDLDFVPLVAREHKVKTILSNSFGFGGVNASIIFGKI